ncbi:MAG: diguanylate cyclase, partial [Chloroflexi bacterium]|nr:diguanylate cyclase [Chloroflexota bacterium]
MSSADRPFALPLGSFRLSRERSVVMGRLERALLVLALPLVGLPILLAAVGPADQALLWERAHLTIAAAIGLGIAIVSHRSASGRVREVRGWLAVAFASWLAAELVRDLGLIGFAGGVPADLGLIVVVVCAMGAYRATLRGRLSGAAELSIYMDAAIVCVAVAASVLALFGAEVLGDEGQVSLLLHSVLFIGLLASTILLDLAVLAPRRLVGPYAIVLGLAFLGLGFIARRELADVLGAWPFATLISIGVLTVAFGTATWTDAVDASPTFAERARRARDLMPLLAVAVVPVLLLPAQILAGNEATTIPISVAIGLITVGAVVRQRILMRDRDRVLGGLRSALDAVERRALQLAGVEAAGRELALNGVRPEALDAVASILAEQFGYDHVSILLGNGADLLPAAQHGRGPLDPGLDGMTGLVGRVARDRQPQLVRDVTVDPDYLAGDLEVRSEICVPLIDGDRLLGVIDVQSTGRQRLDETDLAAVLAVADRLAGARSFDIQRRQLIDEKDFISAILDSVGAIVIVLDADGRLTRYNNATRTVSGYSDADIEAHGSLDFLVPPEQRTDVTRAITRLQTGAPLVRFENEWIRKDGSRRHIAWSNTSVRDEDGVVRHTIATGIDITERKDLEDEIAHRALHDPLTGLPNRRLLLDRLEHSLRRRDSLGTGLLFLDIDDFQAVNDRFGHDVGDEVLKIVAARLGELVRPGDTVSRLSGDEFAIMLEEGKTDAGPEIVARKALDTVARPIDVRDQRLTLTMSIGTALTGPDALTADDLLRNADFAMHAAKTAGRAQARAYVRQERLTAEQDLQLAADLAGAVGRDEFRIHYQPIVDLRSGAVSGLEALIRWEHPEHGWLAPARFIPIAERTGSIVEIGGWVLDSACRALKTWQRDAPGLTMAVNVSARQLESPKLIEHVRRAIRRSEISPASLVLEVTESILVADPDAVAKLGRLKR